MPTSITSSGITFDDATTLTTGVVPTANIANAAVTPAKLSQPYTLATSVASTSGTAIDFTGIPSWAKRITVMFNSVSTSGTSIVQVQIGSSSFTASSYSSHSCAVDGSTAGAASASSGFIIDSGGSAAFSRTGLVEIRLVGSNTWVSTHALGVSGAANARGHFGGGAAPALAGALDRIRVTTVNGTDTFDAGSINISYEG